MKFSFVIPAYNNYKLLHQLLYDIYQKCSTPYEVIITDNGDDEDTKNGITWWMSVGLLPIRYYRQKENLGFLLNSNWGLRMATGDIVSLISTDVRIYGDLVGHWFPQNSLMGGKLYSGSTGWNDFDGKIFPYVEGWLLTAYKTDWEKLGYFDPLYSPNDFEDVDLSTKALSLKMDLLEYPQDYTFHMGAQTLNYGAEREALTKINQEKFRKKWL